MAAPADACAKNSTCCRRATSATASSPSRKTRRCSPSSFSIVFSKGSGLEGHSFGNLFLAALTSVTRRFHRGGAALIGDPAHPRTHLPCDHVERGARSADGGRHPRSGGNEDHRQQGPHQGTVPGSAGSATAAADAGSDCARRPHHHRARFPLHQPDSQRAGARNCRRRS